MNEVESDQECQCLVFFPMYFRGQRDQRGQCSIRYLVRPSKNAASRWDALAYIHFGP